MKNLDSLGVGYPQHSPESATKLSTRPHVPDRYKQSDLKKSPHINELIQRFRNMLVEFNHWLALEDGHDSDRYDNTDIDTSFLIVSGDQQLHDKLGEQKPITAAVRMTEVDHISTSLSAEMWQNAVHPIDANELKETTKRLLGTYDPSALDLTRFLTLATIDTYPEELHEEIAVASIKGMLELFGGGIGYLENDGKIDRNIKNDKVILFTTASPIKNLMQKLGLDIKVLHEGRIGEQDPGESALCACYVVSDILENTKPIDDDPFYAQFKGCLVEAYEAVVGRKHDSC